MNWRVGLLMFAICIGLTVVAAFESNQGNCPLWWLLLWPASVYGLLGVSYAFSSKLGIFLLGKRVYGNGTIHPAAAFYFAPFLVPVWIIWVIRVSLVCPEVPYHEVSPGIFVGRYPRLVPSEFPLSCENVVDLTGEFPARASVTKGRQYLCIPSLDRDMPTPNTFLAGIRTAMSWKGPIYVHCAHGRGRSPGFAACLMVVRGEAPSLSEAVQRMKQVRGVVNIGSLQMEMMEALPLSALAAELTPMVVATTA